MNIKKVYDIDGVKYYRLFSATPHIGLTYSEIYHNYEKWEQPLQLRTHNGLVYVPVRIADYFAAETAGYVPIEYMKKRQPIKKITDANSPERKVIRQSVWTHSLHSAK